MWFFDFAWIVKAVLYGLLAAGPTPFNFAPITTPGPRPCIQCMAAQQ